MRLQVNVFKIAVEEIRSKDRRYDAEAYLFVHEALRRTACAEDSSAPVDHVTVQELLIGIRELALTELGPMTSMVLEHWGVHTCQDLGEIVFNLVQTGLLASSEKDCRIGFATGFDFHDAFRKPFLPRYKQGKAGVCGPQRWNRLRNG